MICAVSASMRVRVSPWEIDEERIVEAYWYRDLVKHAYALASVYERYILRC